MQTITFQIWYLNYRIFTSISQNLYMRVTRLNPLWVSDVMLCYVVLCCILLCCYVMLCYVMLCYVMLCSVLFCSVLFCSVLFCSALFCSILFFSVLTIGKCVSVRSSRYEARGKFGGHERCYVMLYYIRLYCLVLYCIILYYIILYYITLYYSRYYSNYNFPFLIIFLSPGSRQEGFCLKISEK